MFVYYCFREKQFEILTKYVFPHVEKGNLSFWHTYILPILKLPNAGEIMTFCYQNGLDSNICTNYLFNYDFIPTDISMSAYHFMYDAMFPIASYPEIFSFPDQLILTNTHLTLYNIELFSFLLNNAECELDEALELQTSVLYHCLRFEKYALIPALVNHGYKFNDNEIEILRQAVQLTDDECKKIPQLKRGNGLVVAGNSKIFAEFTASEYEQQVISGDVRHRRN